jgi:hypothetical protein
VTAGLKSNFAEKSSGSGQAQWPMNPNGPLAASYLKDHSEKIIHCLEKIVSAWA